MNRKSLILSAGACAALLASQAFAGLFQPQVVQVDIDGAGNGGAIGDMRTARQDKDDDVFIGCGIRSFDDGAGGTFNIGFCQAEDDEGDQVTCFTENAALLETLRATADYSFITFGFVSDGDDGFTCTRIGFSTQSFYLPKDK